MSTIINPGLDSSGNSNNWTVINANWTDSTSTTFDVMSDVPTLTDEDTANFAVINPLHIAGTASNGNLTHTNSSGGSWQNSFGTIYISSGKWYWEGTVSGGIYHTIGVATSEIPLTYGWGTPASGSAFGYIDTSGNKIGPTGYGGGSSYGASFTSGDVIGVALDSNSGTLTFYKNGVSQGVAFSSGLASTLVSPIFGEYNSVSWDINFGQRPFAYTPPTGYKKLNTFNLPDSTITDSSEYFVTALYTGNDATRSIDNTITASDGTETGEAIKFGPDFVWLKARTGGSYSHHLVDAVRGNNKFLMSNKTDVEKTSTDQVTSFDANGFSLGADSAGPNDREVNESGRPMVAWNWDAGNTTAVTYTVKVVSDSGNKYRFDDFGTSAVTLNLHETGTYTFDQSDGSNSGHPLRFSATSDGTHGGGSEYTTGVTVTGTPGSAGAKTVIVVAASAPTLYYYCTVHSGMGGQANTNVTKGSSNFAGSIISTVSANTTAGFSIVTYAGNSASSATVGHGLGIAPKAVIVKGRNYSGAGWPTQINGVYGLRLNETGANDTANGSAFFANTPPTTSVFTLGGSDETNDGYNYLAYCFAEVEGYSKISSYTGNGSADGPFIYTGFRPAFIIFRSTILCNWVIVDSARSTFNVMDDSLYPNTSGSEITTITDVDFLSNGFKWRANLPNETNASGQTYVYMAFAENPFKNSNAR